MKNCCFILLSVCLFWSCDPGYSVDYIINNQTEGNLRIVSSYYTTFTDTSDISSGTQLIFFNEFGLGQHTDDYIEKLEKLPFDTLILEKKDGKTYKGNTLDLTRWIKRIPEKKEGTGSVVLTVEEGDF